MGVPFHSMKENTVFVIHVTRVLRPVGVLLGGSGRARTLTVRAPQLAALMQAHPPAFTLACEAEDGRAAVVASC
jgi:hypothetical protein